MPNIAFQQVLADRPGGKAAEPAHHRQLVDTIGRHRRHAVAAHYAGGPEPAQTVHQIGAQQRRRQMAAALDQNPGQPFLPELFSVSAGSG